MPVNGMMWCMVLDRSYILGNFSTKVFCFWSAGGGCEDDNFFLKKPISSFTAVELTKKNGRTAKHEN